MSRGGNESDGASPNPSWPDQPWDRRRPGSETDVGGRNPARVILVVSVFVGMGLFGLCLLAGLVVPYINEQREGSRRAVCMNNLHSLGMAVGDYEMEHKTYPGFRDGLKVEQLIDVGGISTDVVPVHWVIKVLPYMERADLHRRWEGVSAVDISADGRVTYKFSEGGSGSGYLESLVCPNDEGALAAKAQGRPISYVANSGLQDVAATKDHPADWPDNGVFVSRWEIPQGADAEPLLMASNNADGVSRSDGVSLTFLLGENLGAGNYDDVMLNVGGPGSLQRPVSEQWSCFVWQPHHPLPTNLSQAHINGKPAIGANPSPNLAADISYARPSSNHPGGAIFIYCDMHTRFVSEKIDYLVFTMLMTSNGIQVRTPGTGKPLENPAFNVTNEGGGGEVF